ncbi:hypothetical protein NDI85_11265 [Halomicroarcula sp. S1AR25-4]|uniref:hypothetical protein n=1 Tax=Haloarcula sp. S1AR25-4 TaxID=2950538 RepID=UPI002874A52E|nr:hypothetical protein [Halomicroarcula sp. S1AR25-4]MDS0278377.1 hypothetical protein [Halomicroarcula sp. S1AR25-4]
MSARRVTRWSRAFVAAGVAFFLATHLAIAAGLGRRSVVTVGLYGFVFHVLFGKAYALVPSFFDRELQTATPLPVHAALSVSGTIALALDSVGVTGRSWLGSAGGVLWALGVAVFLGTLSWSVRDNLSGAATGTGGANADRRLVDRRANAVVPVACSYLAVVALVRLLGPVGWPALTTPQVSHLLAAGTAALLVFGVGFRLFPRFLGTHPPQRSVPVVLVSGAVAPVALTVGLFDRRLLVLGGVVEAVAVVGFAVTYLVLFRRSERHRVGLWAVAFAVLAGVGGVALGLTIALVGRDPALVTAHYRTMLLGFLGLTVVGATFQFYPPSVGRWPLASDRTARAAVALLAAGLLGQGLGLLVDVSPVETLGQGVGVVGAGLYAWLVAAAFRSRTT